jgi:hypothetical protein
MWFRPGRDLESEKAESATYVGAGNGVIGQAGDYLLWIKADSSFEAAFEPVSELNAR